MIFNIFALVFLAITIMALIKQNNNIEKRKKKMAQYILLVKVIYTNHVRN